MKITESVDALVRAAIADMGFELDEVEFQKEQGSWVLTLYIDKEGGVTIDDCEAVSRAVDPMLDEADPIEQAYYLSVSSIGLDRPLKRAKDYGRNLGKKVTVKLYAPIDGKKEYTGELKAYDENGFTVDCGGERVFTYKQAAQVKPYLEF